MTATEIESQAFERINLGSRQIERMTNYRLDIAIREAPHFCPIKEDYSSSRDQWDVHKAGRGN